MELTEWLKREGWQVTEDPSGVIQIKGNPDRMIEETDQLLRDLQDNFGIIFDPALKTEDNYAASIKATYDPVTGECFIVVTAL